MQRGCYGVRSVPRLQSEASSMLHFNNESISYTQDIGRALYETTILFLVAGRVFTCHQRITNQVDE